jgi:starch-binding outer membrane protein, SusD/RagB family
MKNVKILFSLLVLVGLLSCNKYLDIDPAQNISESVALTTDANVKSVLRGAYSRLRHSAVYGGRILRNSELLASDGEILWVGTFGGPRQISNKQMFAENEDVRAQWLRCYEVINVANNVLSALDVVNESDRNKVKGEALFIRAIMHFELVRFFGKQYQAGQNNTQLGVPIIATPTREINPENFVARNSVEEVYNQVIADLREAAGLLAPKNGLFAGSDAARSLLARVLLQKGDYAGALAEANTVLNNNNYSLQNSYAAAFNGDTPGSEDVFAIEFTNQDGLNAMTEFWSIPAFGGRDGDIEILPGHLALYEQDDQRLSLFFEGAGATRSGKWNNQFGYIPVIRYAELFLIRAECNARLGSSVGVPPVEDFNRTYTRAGLTPKNSVTLQDILLERRRELAHEGHRIHDIRRLKESFGTWSYDDDKLVLPIPAIEIVTNKNLKQNPGY